VIVPLHGGADYVGRSPGLGDELGFIPVDPHTLQAKVKPNVFALGDATDVPASKAGSVAHFEGEVLAGNVRRFLAGEPLAASFDGHTNCFIETGGGRALLIDFNYDTEPLTGHYPGPFGLPLLRPSRLNHLGKLAFQPLYWHGLLPGRKYWLYRSYRAPTAATAPPPGPRRHRRVQRRAARFTTHHRLRR
jgi:sulfide:quinone oxidoreductase